MSTDLKIMVNGKVHVFCERCGEYKPTTAPDFGYFDNGITLIFVGGYAEYYDPFSREEEVKINLCHECTVEVIKFVGVYNNELFHGGHPSEPNAEQCCDNCWIPIYEDGKWVGQKDPRTNIITYHDGHDHLKLV